MCKICKKLIGTPKDKKSKVKLFYGEKAYDANYYEVIMELDHDDNGDPFAFIKHEVQIRSTGRVYGKPIFIKYCPFCGEKLY